MGYDFLILHICWVAKNWNCSSMGAVFLCGWHPPVSLNFVSKLLHVLLICLFCRLDLFLLLFFSFLHSSSVMPGGFHSSVLVPQFFLAAVGSSRRKRSPLLFCPQPPVSPMSFVWLERVYHDQKLQMFLLPSFSKLILILCKCWSPSTPIWLLT